ncbi:MAG: hypothetical protein AAGF20_00745 [Pseudomonadota bacterium]
MSLNEHVEIHSRVSVLEHRADEAPKTSDLREMEARISETIERHLREMEKRQDERRGLLNAQLKLEIDELSAKIGSTVDEHVKAILDEHAERSKASQERLMRWGIAGAAIIVALLSNGNVNTVFGFLSRLF